MTEVEKRVSLRLLEQARDSAIKRILSIVEEMTNYKQLFPSKYNIVRGTILSSIHELENVAKNLLELKENDGKKG